MKNDIKKEQIEINKNEISIFIDVRSEVVNAAPKMLYETSKEFYIEESKVNDLYIQN